jgi:hypothetical protein
VFERVYGGSYNLISPAFLFLFFFFIIFQVGTESPSCGCEMDSSPFVLQIVLAIV